MDEKVDLNEQPVQPSDTLTNVEKKTSRVNYFAYGSNMDQDRMKERGLIFENVESATLPGYRLAFNKQSSKDPQMGFANVIPAGENERVEGMIYVVSKDQLIKLDKFEGYPKHYDRITIKVRKQDDELVDAIAYIAQPDKIKDGLKPSREYLSHLLAGSDFITTDYRVTLEQIVTLD